MDTYDAFTKHLALLSQGQEKDLTDIFICHGIVHIFMEQFDLAQQLFCQCLRRDGKGISAMGSAKEIIMAAYEEYLFVDEDQWLRMLRDRNGQYEDGVSQCAARIIQQYTAVFAVLAKELKPAK
ncbi:MAG: HI0074 family nucleotidyltransferase substrate-binding subunit [Megasphaera sp.]|jgi:nucleotidyltransferase substrate binding protein (TIGR01987 family)|nr:HI0074 family nucleotidyltransferase substrate-binding subunit [Megasphaera sp.]MCH4188272.1 HI0074 family nucleotidyltransferase substrate-binding subunit [Megasphaera sp.]MCH4218038.1 HI0074 family nucleotidyltransferase substrate-binding subunit [Megasphaera sp.]